MGRGIGLLTICLFAAGCTPGVAIEDARTAAQAAETMMQQAASLNAQGKSAEAEALARKAQDGMVQARDMYLSARADQTYYTQVLTDFAVLCEKLRDYDLAGEAYLRLSQGNKIPAESVREWYGASRNFVSAGGRYVARATEPLDKAEKYVRGGGDFDVSLADILSTRGDISWKNGAYELAAKRYAEALESDPASVRAKMLSACGAIALGNLEYAEKSIEELQAAGAPVGEGTAFDARFREAYEIFRRTRPAMAESAPAYRALAGISVRAGFFADARKAIDHSLTLDERNVFAWNMAGSLAQRDGDIERAKQAFAKSLELEPNQPRTREALERLPQPKP